MMKPVHKLWFIHIILYASYIVHSATIKGKFGYLEEEQRDVYVSEYIDVNSFNDNQGDDLTLQTLKMRSNFMPLATFSEQPKTSAIKNRKEVCCQDGDCHDLRIHRAGSTVDYMRATLPFEFLATWLAQSNSFWKPFLYLLLNDHFRRISRKLLLTINCSVGVKVQPINTDAVVIAVSGVRGVGPACHLQGLSEKYMDEILERTLSSSSLHALQKIYGSGYLHRGMPWDAMEVYSIMR
ncbi:uncharacterized protein CBL_12071 [Carabus blaptoides fortunei]